MVLTVVTSQSSTGSLSRVQDFDESIVSVSTTFHAGAQLDRHDPDLMLMSPDSVLFYVHSSIIYLPSCNDQSRPILPLTPPQEAYSEDGQKSVIISVPESSEILNIILHAAYNMSCAQYFPSFDTLVIAVNSLSTYGLDVRNILSTTPFYDVLLSNALTSPLELYALAAHHDLYDLAVATSPHLLSLSLSTITDAVCESMGPVYLKRLFFLHLGRCDALRRVLQPLPHPHPQTPTCGVNEQRKLALALEMASTYLVWDPRPGQSRFSYMCFALA